MRAKEEREMEMEGVSVFRYLMCGAKGAWCKARSPESTRPLFLCFLYFPLLSSVFFALLASFVCPCPSRMRSPCGALSSCSWRHSSASLPFRKAVRSDCRYTEAALAYRRRDAGLEDGKCAPRWPRARILASVHEWSGESHGKNYFAMHLPRRSN